MAITPITSTGITGIGATAAAPTTGTTPPAAGGNAAIGTGYSATPSAEGGGLLDDIGTAVSSVASSAVNGLVSMAAKMKGDQDAQINGMMASEGTSFDPTKLQAIMAQSTQMEMTMQLAQKIQEKNDNAASVWLR